MDPRVEKLAEIMVNYSLGLKRGQWLKIQAGYVALPLVKAVYAKALEVGANPYYTVVSEELQELFLRHGSDEQLRFVSDIQKLEAEKLDAMFAVIAGENKKYLTNVDPKRQALAQSARKDMFKTFLERTARGELHWVGTAYPTHSAAQEAEMSLSEYEDFVYGAGHLNDPDPVAHWKKVSQRQAKIVTFLESFSQIRAVSRETDLTIKTTGRKWINCDGKMNFPDGEVFTTPLEDTAEGHILYSFPACYAGREVENVRLKFKAGKVIGFSASKNQNYLEQMIGMDPGASCLGEFAIGTNYDITRFTKDTLFDEKIGGTIHLALGAAPPETGGKNQSALHWDMVCDLREGGELYGDGRLFYKDGKFLREF